MSKVLENQDFYEIINKSIQDIGAKSFAPEIYKMVISAMNNSYRFYHNFYHLQEMTLIPERHLEDLEKLDIKNFDRFLGYIRIAGFFHDIIYIQNDGSVDGNFQPFLDKNLNKINGEWYIVDVKDDIVLKLCAKIFDIKVNEFISAFKINEFLSSVVIARILDSMGLDETTIAKIVICIEATVPFRSQENFNKRLKIIKKILPSEDIDEIMYASIYLANKDCYNFSGYENDSVSERLTNFLQNSWRLVLENSPNIKNITISSVDFLKIIKNNLKFFNIMLQTEEYKNIFHSYKEYPTRFKQLYYEERTKELLQYAIVSHDIKFVVSGIFASIKALDPDEEIYPFSLLNELSYIHIKKPKDEYFVFNIQNGRTKTRDEAIMNSLTCSRKYPSAIFDGGKSPIGRFLYKALPESSIIKIANFLYESDLGFENVELNKIKANEFLNKVLEIVNPDVFNVILDTLEGVFSQLNIPNRLEIIKSLRPI